MMLFFRVSEVGKCLRSVYFARVLGRLEDVDSRPEVMEGKALHKNFQDEWVENVDGEAKTEEEVMFLHDKFVVRGKADIVSEDKVIEVKTTSRLPSRPYITHVRQLNFYLGLLKFEKGLLIYLLRDGNGRKEFTISFDEGMFVNDVKRFEKLYDCLMNFIVPEREPSALCNFCEYRFLCEKIK